MKTWVLILALGMAWGGLAFADDGPYRIRVDGLSCPFCSYGIEKKLKSLDGVTRVEVDMEKGVVTVRVAPDATVSDERLRQAVRDAGFTPREIVREERQP